MHTLANACALKHTCNPVFSPQSQGPISHTTQLINLLGCTAHSSRGKQSCKLIQDDACREAWVALQTIRLILQFREYNMLSCLFCFLLRMLWLNNEY